ncbi:MAG: ABC transporter substrate-binding protein [Chlorobi bacterium]|nr:ABC transporter substrate-binding protein [Chlorobiota bacterium]
MRLPMVQRERAYLPCSIVVTVVVAAMGVVGSSCKHRSTPDPSQLRPAADNRWYGGTYRVNETGELRSLDPVAINDVTSAHISENIYDQLLYFDANLNLTCELAERWEVSPDGRLYTYFLRRGVYFHDDPCFPGGKGRELTAEDVAYSLTRCCDARTGTLSADYFRGKVIGAEEYYIATSQAAARGIEPSVRSVRGFHVLDRYTFRIELLEPFGPFEYYVAMNFTGIHPREAVEYYGKDFFQHPVGTGPFTFVEWTPDRECLLVRNNRYWKHDSAGNRLPYLDTLRFTFIKDDKVQFLEFTEGNLDECYRIPSEFFLLVVDEHKHLRPSFQRFQLLRVPALSTQYYGMLTTAEPFRDRRVRQAFCYAVDRERILRYVLKGQGGEPAHHGLVPSAMPDYPAWSVTGYHFNPTKARQLLADAGYPMGHNFPSIELQLNSGGGRNLLIAEAVQSELAEVLGIRVGLKLVEFARHLDEIDHGRAPFYRLGWIADYPDPESFLNLFYGKLVPSDSTAPSPLNSTRYRNKLYDEVFEAARRVLDRQQRNQLFARAEQIAIADAPILLLFYDEDYRLLQPYVRGYRNNAMDRRQYVYVWFDPAATAR